VKGKFPEYPVLTLRSRGRRLAEALRLMAAGKKLGLK
jgi:hypothetical protein